MLVRFFALLRIKPHNPLLVRVPVNSFEFHSCERTPQVEYLMRCLLYTSDAAEGRIGDWGEVVTR